MDEYSRVTEVFLTCFQLLKELSFFAARLGTSVYECRSKCFGNIFCIILHSRKYITLTGTWLMKKKNKRHKYIGSVFSLNFLQNNTVAATAFLQEDKIMGIPIMSVQDNNDS